MKQDINPILGVLGTVMIIFFVLSLVAIIFRPSGKAEGHISKYPNITGICFALGQPDIPNSTPAYWVEQSALSGMSHQTRANLRCKLYLNGEPVQADLDEIMVERK